MSILRKKEMRSMTEKDLVEKLKELRMEMMKNNAQRASHQSTGKIKEIRRTCARIMTLLKEKLKK